MRYLFFVLLIVITTISARGQWDATTYPHNSAIRIVETAAESVVFAYSAQGGLFKSSNGGNTWANLEMKYDNFTEATFYLFGIIPSDLQFSDANNGFIFGRNHYLSHQVIFKTSNGGASWNLVYSNSGETISQMDFPTALVGYACGTNGTVVKTTDAGVTWTKLPTPTSKPLRSITFFDNNTGVAAGEDIILRTTDGGQSWITISTLYNIRSISLADHIFGFATDYDGELLNTADGGITWTRTNMNFTGPGGWAKTVEFINSDVAVLSTANGLYKTKKGSALWVKDHEFEGQEIDDVDFNKSLEGFGATHLNEFPYTQFFYKTTTGGTPFPINEARVSVIAVPDDNNCRGQYPVQIKFINGAYKGLETATLNWSVNGQVQPPITWNGNILPGDTSAWVNVGMYDFNRSARDFDVRVWTSAPNGVPDDYPGNDEATAIFRFNGLTGEYIVRGANADFETFKEVQELLQHEQVCGPVTIKLSAGTYDGPMTFTKVQNASAENSITIQSETGLPGDVIITNPFFGIVIQFENTEHLKVKGLVIRGSSSVASIYNGHHITLENNYFEQTGSTDIGSLVTSRPTGTVLFKNNTFSGGHVGLWLSGKPATNTDAQIITNNIFIGQREYGISITGQMAATIMSNKFNYGTGTAPIVAINAHYLENEMLIANNYFDLINTNPNTGKLAMSLFVGRYRIYHNTINRKGLGEYPTISLEGFQFADIKNNNFYNEAPGPILYLSTIENVNSDYNNFFATGNMILFYANSHRQTMMNLDSWRSVSGLDAHSLSVNPQLTPGDAHLNLTTSNYALNGAGTKLSQIDFDIDNEIRDVVHPDIGADEVQQPQTDVSLISIDTRAVNICTATPVKIKVSNAGSKAIDGISINWSINNLSQSPYTSNVPLNSGDVREITLGDIDFATGENHIYATVATANDLNQRNDTISMVVKAGVGMTGTYTIGGSNPSFPNLNAATTALRESGVCGPVTFNIRPGTYEEQLHLTEYEGASESNSIIFQSAVDDSTAVQITSPVTVLILDGAKFITVKGVTFSASAQSSKLVQIQNGSHHNMIASCRFEVLTNGSGIFSESGLLPNEYNVITGNAFDIEGGSNQGNAIYFSGSGGYERNNRIEHNRFTFLSGTSIAAIEVNGQDNFSAAHNYISGYVLSGISISSSINGFNIFGNQIYGPALGIVVSTYLPEKGVNLCTVASNIVNAGSASLRTVNVDKLLVNNNTFVSAGEYATVVIFGLTDRSQAKISVMNNIIISRGTGYCLMTDPNAKAVSDYNIFYTAKDHFVIYNDDNTSWSQDLVSFESLHHWKTRSGNDSNSRVFNPRFFSENDLHIRSDSRVKNAGTNAQVLTDVDGAPRNVSNPDIGADEFTITPTTNDAGISKQVRPEECDNHGDIQVFIRNYGTNTLTSAEVHWTINGNVMNTLNWSGSLAPGNESAALSLGNVPLMAHDTFNIKVWVEMPNLVNDTENINDTLFIRDIFQKLKGTYTVGGTDADFPSLTRVAKYLNNVGVCGPVDFLIHPGNYRDKILLHEIQGTSETNRISFQPEDGDVSSVRLEVGTRVNETSSVITLDGTDFITVKNISFLATQYANACIHLSGVTNHNEFVDNRFFGKTTGTNQGTFGSHISFGSGNHSNTVIRNNIFNDGGYGVLGESAMQNTTIENNHFHSQSVSITSINHNSTIKGNTFTTKPESDYTIPGAIRVRSGNSLEIANNIIAGNYSFGISVEHSGSRHERSIVSNNAISGLTTGMNYGIFSYWTENVHYVFNSVRINNRWENTAFRSKGDTAVVIANNNLVNIGTGSSLHVDFLKPKGFNIDYNNLYSSDNAFHFNSIKYTSLRSYQDGSGLDQHSISIDPEFRSESDLHALNPAMDKTGTPMSGVQFDIDEQPRDLLHPDIGADEIRVVGTDAGVIAISGHNDICEGQTEMFVTVHNYGNLPLNKLNIHWSINDEEQSVYQWQGNLPAQEKLINVKLGGFNFHVNTIYKIKSWTSLPNGGSDHAVANDSAIVQNHSPRLRGNYTIGENGYFSSIVDAVDKLKANGICGPVVFNIRDGRYEGQVTIPAIVGSSAENTVIFQSESGDSSRVIVTIDLMTYDDWVWKFDKANYMTLRNVTIAAPLNSYYDGLWIDGPINDVLVTGNQIISSGDQWQYTGTCMYLAGLTTSDVTIENNLFKSGRVGLDIASGWGFGNGANQRITIRNNIFSDQLYGGIAAVFTNNSIIEGNVIRTTKNNFEWFRGIYFMFSDTISIRKNRIYLSGKGMELFHCSGLKVNNNFITITEKLPALPKYGIDVQGMSDNWFYYNSILMLDSHENSTPFIIGTGVEQKLGVTQIRNNIFSNIGGASAFSANYYAFGIPSYFTSDYNNLYSSGANLVTKDSKQYANLKAWQNATTNDDHSISVNPEFASIDDFHFPSIAHINAGTALDVNEDIDGQLRHPQTPCIGADEFQPLQIDAGMSAWNESMACNLPESPLTIRVTNRGSITLSAMTFKWSINDQTPQESSWNGTLAKGLSIEYELPFQEFEYNTDYSIAIQIINVNGNPDQNNSNNKLTFNFKLYRPVVLGEDIEECTLEHKTFLLDAGEGYSEYKWSNDVTTQTIYIENPGSYSVSVKDFNGCISSDAISINALTLSELSVTPSVLCTGTTAQLTVLPTGDSFEYVWMHNNEIIEGADSHTLTVADQGEYKVTVTGGDCSLTLSTVTVVAEACPMDITLNGDILTAPSNSSNYQWYRNGVLMPGQQSHQLTFTEAGVYTVTFTRHNQTLISNPITITITDLETSLTGIKIYPNPTTRILIIKNIIQLKESLRVTLTDLSGREIIHKPTWIENDLYIDLDDAAPGVYVLELKHQSTVTNTKVMVIK